MKTVKQYITSLYESDLPEILKKYPGLKLSRLLDEYCFYSSKFSHEYLPGLESEFSSKIFKGIPLEYISKNSFFYRSNFFVDKRVLIPRSETEILVENSIEYIKKNHHDNFKVAEIGVGSFALGLSILCDISKRVYFWGGDIDPCALEVAHINLFKLRSKINPKTKVKLALSDRLGAVDEKFDFIVSNPPYIKEKQDKAGVHPQTDKFEPHIALYLPDESYDHWFADFFSQVSEKLCAKGAFFMEGHEDSLSHLQKIGLKYFSKVLVKKDYTGRDRFLQAYK
jgi:release factor glutamine methyltransferase